MLSVSKLYIYPVKSLGGISVSSAVVTDRGFQNDRRYMLVDMNGLFLTQRERPAMALLRTAIEADELIIWHRNKVSEKLQVPLVPEYSLSTVTVKVWDDYCEAHYVSDEADQWFSDKLNSPCRLLYMPESTKRVVDPAYALKNDITSFTDGYPVLLIGQPSLDDLNSRMEEVLPMDRFRPGIVMEGGQPFEEDTMAQFSINDINFYGVKLCARCTITTTNQETGVTGKEPLKTLAKYRTANNKVYFGQNVLCAGKGVIKVGDTINSIKVKSSLI
ncbi:MAG: MOSC N-terminal beta barrel domain-containing protein [Chitinophagaceae bacterium]